MEIPAQLQCLFAGQLTEQDGSFVVEVPDQELQLGSLSEDETYRVALLPAPTETTDTVTELTADKTQSPPEPPVEEGETRDVEIESLGDQGDGITRVERGFVVIVPDTKPSERVTVEITDVRENVAFASVVERLSYYE